jgi:hypothetical protein
MTELSSELELLGEQLHAAFGRHVARRRRRRRLHVAGASFLGVLVFAAAALASGIGPDLQLDPTKWTILGGGSVDGGKASFVHAQRKDDGGHSLFMVEHDAGLDRYEAFLLHEKVKALGNAAEAAEGVPVRTEPGELCTTAQLTRAENVALDTLRASFAPGVAPDVAKPGVDKAIQAAFADSPCRGLEYAGETARFVYAGIQPKSNVMPGAR